MSTKSMDEYVERMFDKKIQDIDKTNDIYERDFFRGNYFRIPKGNILKGLSFNDCLKKFKCIAFDSDRSDLCAIFESLRDFFFFSAGNDLIYRKKLEADSYHEVPIKEIILPVILDDIHKKYGDDIYFHPTRNSVVQNVDNTINKSFIISTFLYFLYCDDFIPTRNMKKKFPSSYEDITSTLILHPITIGDYLIALIKFKCDKFRDVFSVVPDEDLRKEFLNRVDDLQRDKIKEVSNLYNANLHICYFFNHSVYEYVSNTLAEEKKTLIKKNN